MTSTSEARHVDIVMFNGVDELDVVAPFEILASTGFDVALVTLQPCPSVIGSHGMTFVPDGLLSANPDLLVVPGGRWASKAPDSAWGEVQREVLPQAIADRHAKGTRIAGVCTGAMLIAAGGLLRGRPAVTHRSALEDLSNYGARVRPEARVVDDGDVLTSGGVTSGIDLALRLIEREYGREAALREATRIEHDYRGPVSSKA